MARRSRLLTTVAFPLVSLSLLVQPAGAAGIRADAAGFVTSDVVRTQSEEIVEGTEQAPEGGQLSREERRKLRAQKRQQEQQADQQADQQTEQPVKRKPKREQQAEQQQSEQPAAEQAQESQPSRDELRKQREQQKKAQQQKRADQQKAEEQSREEQRKKRQQERQQQQQLEQQAEQPAVEDQAQAAQPAGEAQDQQKELSREEQRKKRQQERQQQQLEQQQAEQPAVEDQQQAAQPADEAQDQQKELSREEQRKKRQQERQQQQQLEQQQAQEQQNAKPQAAQKASNEKPEVRERKRRNAENPAATDETIVLPVDNGTAVLDSDKDADRSGNAQTREERRKQRAERRNVKAPTSDADAQVDKAGRPRGPVKVENVTRERGQALRERPRYEVPEGVNIRRREDNRTIINIDNRTIVRHDDSYRFRRGGERVSYESLSHGRVREVVVKPNGDRIITVRNRWGDIIRRSRVDARQREYVLFYSPELYDNPDVRYVYRDPGLRLPPMRLTIPVSDYIIDTSSQPNRDYYDFLDQPPVEPVERVYTLDEVKYSARIRDKVRRIDLDTITFATGSAEISMNQASSLRRVADAINKALDNDPAETFLIEGHTDAVGSDESNLILSDERAESVANVLTDVYGIPPENLTTQGYGERFLKVNTDGPEQQNRRVTIRRVTALVRPAQISQQGE